MPDPADFDSQSEFMSACIPEVLEDGTASDQDQAVAVCNSMWEARSMGDERFERGVEIQRNSVDAEAGTFEAVVFTGGEANDGHILNIRGAELGEPRIPLFVNHMADPTFQLGSLTEPTRSDDRIVYRGEIETSGEGPAADMRRDVLNMMQRGHVHRLSGRWDARDEDVTRRINLPKDHPAFVSDKAEGAQRYGLYFERWRPMEGSIVGLGSDPQAQIRAWQRADEHQARVLEAYRQFNVSELVEIQLKDGSPFFVPPELAARMAEQTEGELPSDDPEPRGEPAGDDPLNHPMPSVYGTLLREFQAQLANREVLEGVAKDLGDELAKLRAGPDPEEIYRDEIRRKIGMILPRKR